MRMEKSGSPEKVCRLTAIIIQQINDGRYLSVRRKCKLLVTFNGQCHTLASADTKRASPLRALRFTIS